MSPISISVGGQLFTTEDINAEEHHFIFRRLGENVTDAVFHHVHIPIFLIKINQVCDKAKEKIRAYANNVFKNQ
jgi:hypothetical protein